MPTVGANLREIFAAWFLRRKKYVSHFGMDLDEA